MRFAEAFLARDPFVFADALLAHNQFAFADALLGKTWRTDTVVWNTHPERDIGAEFPCQECEELDGQMFDLTDLPDRPHFGCNCTFNDAKTGEELSGLEMFLRVETGLQRHHSTVSSAFKLHTVHRGTTSSDVAKYNHQHKPTGSQGGQFTTVSGTGGGGTPKPHGRPDLDINGPDRNDPGYVAPTHDLTTPPDVANDSPEQAAREAAWLAHRQNWPTHDGNRTPDALDDDTKAPAGNTMTATRRSTNPNETHIDNKKLNTLIERGVLPNENEQGTISNGKLKMQVVDELSDRSGLSYERTNELVATWAGTSSDHRPDSIALQMAAAAQFGVTPGPFIQDQADDMAAHPERAPIDTIGHTDITPYGPWNARMADASKFVSAMYAYTQETLAAQGIKSVTVYRGMGFLQTEDTHGLTLWEPGNAEYDANASNVALYTASAASGKPSTLDHNPITSWSTDAAEAVNFAREQDGGGGAFVLSADVPATRILSTAATGIGCQEEYEITVVGGHGRKSDTVNVRQLQGSGSPDINAMGNDPEMNPTAGEDFDVSYHDPQADIDAIYGGPAETVGAGVYTDEHVAAATGQDPGGRMIDGVLQTNDPGAALQAMWMGVKAQLQQPRQLSTMLTLLHEQAQKAMAAGKDAQDLDLNLVAVKGTNIFVEGHLVGKRIDMPQLATKNPVPGSTADAQPRSAKGEVDMTDAFVQSLEASGVKVTHETEHAAYLRFTQGEVGGPQVAGMMTAINNGTAPDIAKRPIVISRDNYVLDGHHTVAAVVGVDSMDNILGNDTEMNVTRLDISILDLLESAQSFADEMGLPNKAVGSPKLKDGLLVPAQHQRLPDVPEPKAPPEPSSIPSSSSLYDRAITSEGFTISAHDSSEPTDGFAVGGYASSLTIPDTTSPTEAAVAIDRWRATNVLQIAEGGHLGGWHNTQANTVVLDATRVWSADQRTQAVADGMMRNQISVYDIGTGDTVDTGGTGAFRPPYARGNHFGFGPEEIYHPKDEKLGEKAVAQMHANLESIGATFDEMLNQARIAFNHATPDQLKKHWYPEERAQVLAELHKMEAEEFGGRSIATDAQAIAIIAAMSNNMAWSLSGPDGIPGTADDAFPNIKVAMSLIRAANTNKSYTFTQEDIDAFKVLPSGTGKTLAFKPDEIPKVGTTKFDDLSMQAQALFAIGEAHTGGMPKGGQHSLNIARARGDNIPTTIRANLHGSKVRNFAANIMDPNDPAYVTIDRHAARALLHNFMSGKQAENFVRSKDGGYAILSSVYFALAEELGLPANQVQAIIWDQVRPMKQNDPDYATRYIMSGPQDDPLWGRKGGVAVPSPWPADIATPPNAMQIPNFAQAARDQEIADAHEPHDANEVYNAERYLQSVKAVGQKFPTQAGAQDYVTALMAKYAPGLDPGDYPVVRYGGGTLEPGDIAETTWPNSINGQPEMHDIGINVAKVGHNQLTLTHEAAHVIAVYLEGQFLSGHGAAFRRAYAAILAAEVSPAGSANLGAFAADYFPPSTALGKSEHIPMASDTDSVANRDRIAVATITVGGKVVLVCYGGTDE